jgi:hypothetical protein
LGRYLENPVGLDRNSPEARRFSILGRYLENPVGLDRNSPEARRFSIGQIPGETGRPRPELA